jgi:hypothetical protein
MINFFSKIRHQLSNENKFQKYFRYAFGEILLVVIGILIALQVNNWNEQRKQDDEFKVTLEQIYNALKIDVDDFDSKIKAYDNALSTIDFLLDYPDSIPKYDLPYVLNSFRIDPFERKSETFYHAKNLKYNVSNQQQNEISKQIINYVNNLDFTDDSILDEFQSELKRIHLPFPKVDITSYNSNWITNDSTYYSHDDLNNVLNLIKSVEFRAVLKTLRTEVYYQKGKTLVRYGDGISLMNIIKKQYPDVKLLFQDVGLKGTAIDGFDNVGGLSTPMVRTDSENDIWELDIYLLQGNVKFRCRDSWAQNWGNSDFPKGTGYQDGPDISIPEEGNYHVIFKPATGEYEFIKLDD